MSNMDPGAEFQRKVDELLEIYGVPRDNEANQESKNRLIDTLNSVFMDKANQETELQKARNVGEAGIGKGIDPTNLTITNVAIILRSIVGNDTSVNHLLKPAENLISQYSELMVTERAREKGEITPITEGVNNMLGMTDVIGEEEDWGKNSQQDAFSFQREIDGRGGTKFQFQEYKRQTDSNSVNEGQKNSDPTGKNKTPRKGWFR